MFLPVREHTSLIGSGGHNHDGAQESAIFSSVSGTGSLHETTRLRAQVPRPSLLSKAYATRAKTCARRTTVHLHPCCARHPSLRASDSPDKAQHQLRPPELRIPYYTSYNTMSPSYTPLPGIMTTLTLQTSLILVVGLHAVCRCTISGAQVDSETRIPGVTMTARVDIFTKAVTQQQPTIRSNQMPEPNMRLAP